MAVIGLPVKKPTVKPVIAPQNAGIPGAAPKAAYVAPAAPYGPGGAFAGLGVEGSGQPTAIGGGAAPSPVQAAIAAPAAAAPPAVNFDAMTQIDPEYTRGKDNLDASNAMTVKALKDAFAGNTQASADNANSHGGLFSGAEAQQQANLSDAYGNPVNGAVAKQTLANKTAHDTLYFNVFNRLVAAAANPSGGTSNGSILA